ncbi:MAG: SprB repeat-containing protein [Bacteroidetes bacterium]|nr:SprB repeat-containing protein [Bacteroidota bacterium]
MRRSRFASLSPFQLNSAGNGSTTASAVNNGSSDACGIASTTLNNSSFTCANVAGPNTVILTVTDVNGNSSTCSAAVTVQDNIAPIALCQPVTVQLNSAGNGSTTASAVNNGSSDACGIATTTLNNSSFTCANVAGPNTVILTVTDVNGNSSTCSAAVTVQDNIAPIALCQNLTINLGSSGSQTVLASSINNGSNDACGIATTTLNPNTFTCDDLGVNNVTLTVTDVNANSSTCAATVTVTNDPLVATTASPTVACGYNVTCNGATNGSATVTTTGGCLPYTYLWSNGQTTATANGLGAGSYTVTVTDLNGNTTTSTLTLTEPALLTSATTSPVYQGGWNVTCNGANDGSIDLTAGGGASCLSYTYLWSNGATTEDLSSIGAGTYDVTVTDANGCSSTSSITLTAPNSLSNTLIPQVYQGGWNISCNGASDGMLFANVSGGTPAYNYAWSNGATTQLVTGLGAGTYTVTVTDQNGCFLVNSITLTEPPLMTDAISAVVRNCGFNVSCFGANDGSIDYTVNGGTAPYNYIWSNGATSEDISGLAAGTYSVTATDRNGCFTTETIVLTEPALLTANISLGTYACGYNVSCNGASNGSATVNTAGGCTPYTYTWSTLGVSASINGLPAIAVAVTVTDANGCQAYATGELIEPALLESSGVPSTYACGTNVSCNGANDGSINLTVTGGASCVAYTYLWSNGATTEDVSNLTAGNYSVTITDANGCSTSSSFTLTEPALLVSSGVAATYVCGTNVSCNGANDGSINLTVTGGASCTAYTFNWSNGATTEDVSNLTAGNYSVTITDANGCSTSSSFTLTEPALLVSSGVAATYVCGTNVSCNGANDGSINLTVTGGASCTAYTFNWSNGATTEDVSNLTAGNYSVTITDANGCSAQAAASRSPSQHCSSAQVSPQLMSAERT